MKRLEHVRLFQSVLQNDLQDRLWAFFVNRVRAPWDPGNPHMWFLLLHDIHIALRIEVHFGRVSRENSDSGVFGFFEAGQ